MVELKVVSIKKKKFEAITSINFGKVVNFRFKIFNNFNGMNVKFGTHVHDVRGYTQVSHSLFSSGQ